MLKFISSLSLLLILTATVTAQDSSVTRKPDTNYSQKNIRVIPDPEDIVFTKTEIEAAFTGGEGAWKMYLRQKLNENIAAERGAPAGTYEVVVRFIVAPDGKVSNITTETNYAYGMEKEVIKIIKAGPNWKPAIQNGRSVRAYKRQTVKFIVPQN